nr:leukocyte receptor cluster member 1 homolog [Ipomoea trifida]
MSTTTITARKSAAARDEQLKCYDAHKRDVELRLEKLRQVRGLASASVNETATPFSSKSKSEETRLENDLNHINLFEGIRIFDPIEAKPTSKADQSRPKKSDERSDDNDDDDLRPAKKKSNGKKTVEELRKERLEREKQRERALLKEKSRRDGGFSFRR